ncbi:MAG: tRNA pseudouridine(55) synthase TruB [Proteobacteria bacterium]|nr:tRNA pseudouridine(55) synthase TruB [Pseudomonadota bacterium]
MNQKSKKRDVDGWLIIDKPAGITSTSVVNKVKWLFQAKKAGHAGTLDPDATGLLAVAFGEATKTIPYITDGLKTYEFVITLGAATTTDDAEGDIINSNELRPTDADIQAALPAFTGLILQTPPKFSAVKINGERAYTIARRGDDVELAARELFVNKLEFVNRLSQDDVELVLQCGKGGYVRSIARDLGEALGCLAHVKWLRRLDTGPFDIKQSITLDDLIAVEDMADREALLLPTEAGLAELEYVRISDQAATDIQHGMSVTVDTDPSGPDTPVWANYEGKAQAIGTVELGTFKPKRVILQRNP